MSRLQLAVGLEVQSLKTWSDEPLAAMSVALSELSSGNVVS